jgi:hypothetical protein
MAAAINTTTVTSRTVFGNKRIVIGYINFTASTWTSGGLAFDGSNVGIAPTIDMMILTPGDLEYYYDYTNGVVDAYLCGTAGQNVQVKANGATVSTNPVYFMIIGHGAG